MQKDCFVQVVTQICTFKGSLQTIGKKVVFAERNDDTPQTIASEAGYKIQGKQESQIHRKRESQKRFLLMVEM